MVIIRILYLLIEIVSIIVLLKGILGYSFRQNKAWIVAGVMTFVLSSLIEEVIIPNGGHLLYWLKIFVPSAGMALLFEGRKVTLFLISGCMLCVSSPLESLGIGIGILLRKGVDVIEMNLVLIYIAALLVKLAVIVVLYLLFRKKNRNFRDYAESLNGIIFVLFLAYARMAEYRPIMFIGGISAQMEAEFEVVRGQNMIKDGIADLVVFLSMVLICILVCQHKAMGRMLYLNERCIEEQTEQYRLLSRGDRELRRFRHDYNSHITVLQALADAGDLERLQAYVKRLKAVQEKFKFIRTNNMICDAIFNQYFALCRDAGFELTVKGTFPEKLEIAETDLCVVLSNGVKNAYEAAMECEAERRKLDIEINSRGRIVYVVIRNSTAREPVIKNGIFVTTKKDKRSHGWGIRNMIDSVQKSGGSVSWKCEADKVETEIVLKEKI